MSIALVVYILTFLVGVVVIITRLRLRRPGAGGGHVAVGSGLLNLHTMAGVLGLAAWIAFLASEDWIGKDSRSLLGIAGLGLLWITVLAGLLLLLRWKPTRGRRAKTISDQSSRGVRGLSLVGHLGMLVAVPVLTYGYLISAV